MKSKRIITLGVVFLLAFTCCVSALAEEQLTYQSTLFDHSKIIEIDIQMSEEAWDEMVANAASEEYVPCDLVVNGVAYPNASIRPKGNSSLLSVSMLGSDRFSFRIKFDKYEKKRTCDGLNILILNNGFKDAGNLHEALAYDMYAYLVADASLYNYARVSVNGEYFGTYLALEGVDKSFAKRNYGEEYGKLYKPDNANLNGMNDVEGEAVNMLQMLAGMLGGNAAEAEEGQNPFADFAKSLGGQANPEESDDFSASFGGSSGESAAPEGGFDMNDFMAAFGDREKSDSELAMALNYVGDDLSLYQDIWDSAKFKSDDTDHARVVEALRHVSERDDIANYVDMDNVLRYMAIQAFIYNPDGLTGIVSHNYYLYEKDGRLNLIPWDMNEAFSLSGDGSDFVNFPIDTPFTINDLSQRDFFMAILENDEYLAQYHEYLRILAEDYALGGGLDAALNNIHGQIDDLVAEDTTAFCTYEEYMATAEGLSAAIKLRAQSVLGQLKGSIPATREEQKVHPELLLDVSGADLSALTGDIGIGFKTGEGKEGFAQLFENMDDFVDSFGGSSGSPAGEDAP